jgi:small subunit ribosomal protein S17
VTADTTQTARAANRRRRLVGVVTSDKMDKTITVEVIRLKLDPKYKKYIRVRSRYKAHDEDNQFRIGDKVEIVESRPLSRTKRWNTARLVRRGEGELS